MTAPPDLREQLQAALGDTYIVERELGGGGMSRVFVARDAALKREVVIKVLIPEMADGLSADRFQREIELAARLQHPNIVPLLAAGTAVGLPYYTMPLVAGESLRARLARDGELSVQEATSILRDVARALAYAHAQGVVHRDIKPDNVLLAGDYAVVTDFGVAKALAASQRTGAEPREPSTGALTALGTALGTPAYMSPEQAAGDPSTDARTDIYALGVMAYEMLTRGAGRHAREASGRTRARRVGRLDAEACRRRSVQRGGGESHRHSPVGTVGEYAAGVRRVKAEEFLRSSMAVHVH